MARKQSLGDAVYQRIGWWMVISYNLTLWLMSALLTVLLIVIFARVHPLTNQQVLDYATMLGMVWAVFIVVSVLHTAVAARPLRRFVRGETGPVEAWRAAVGLPTEFMKFNYLLAVIGTVLGLVLLARVVSLDAEVVSLYLLGCTGLYLYMLAALSFIAGAFIRPVLRAISTDLNGAVPPESGIPLFQRTVFVMPAVSVSMAMVGAGIAFEPEIGSGNAALKLVIVFIAATIATAPVTLLFARSVNLPIEDLLAGTKRIKAGDYSTPVPELSADELGELARSFNEAMQGLAERQQLAREVRASRARIISAGDESRKRIERNIHDGAQQRLVALALDMKLLEEMAPSMRSDEVVVAARQAGEGLKETLAELRELARGLHPQILTTDGLGPALGQLANRAKLPVQVEVPDQRYPEGVETAAYFVAAEALANVSKYAKADSARISVRQQNGSLSVEVADDGIGGASLGSGTGLAGLADRVAALDGRLVIDSPAGKGTRVRAEIPVRG